MYTKKARTILIILTLAVTILALLNLDNKLFVTLPILIAIMIQTYSILKNKNSKKLDILMILPLILAVVVLVVSHFNN
ncbi:hypothetical protein [Sporosalibacterium faouarense]|uniref:hypothetical protein n=1 Tax=Sporosalibacterium faouarense TaxID=516123 RepID=UPI00141D7151|nr:hypothetical protein [Sporosalibacterium faouarense]MTI46543.1 hypothetical protein [Bacillota bacterium]